MLYVGVDFGIGYLDTLLSRVLIENPGQDGLLHLGRVRCTNLPSQHSGYNRKSHPGGHMASVAATGPKTNWPGDSEDHEPMPRLQCQRV